VYRAPPTNPDLEEQILKAARKLWKREGQRAYHARGCGSGRDQYAAVYRRFATGGHFAGAAAAHPLEFAAVLKAAPSPKRLASGMLITG